MLEETLRGLQEGEDKMEGGRMGEEERRKGSSAAPLLSLSLLSVVLIVVAVCECVLMCRKRCRHVSRCAVCACQAKRAIIDSLPLLLSPKSRATRQLCLLSTYIRYDT